MKKKLKSGRGFTVVEMLAAAVVLILLGLMMNTGFQMALRTYRSITARSELDLLLSTAVDALADDLRYARNVSGEGTGFTYRSDSFGENASFTVDTSDTSDTKGQILANGLRVLSTGAYGLNGAYRVSDLEITAHTGDDGEVTFTIELTVETTDAGSPMRASTPAGGITVRCLNRKTESTPPGGETP